MLNVLRCLAIVYSENNIALKERTNKKRGNLVRKRLIKSLEKKHRATEKKRGQKCKNHPQGNCKEKMTTVISWG